MFSAAEFTDSLFSPGLSFETHALALFRHQYANNPLYRRYTDLLGIVPEKLSTAADIPFLPIGLFKTHAVQTGTFTPALTFESSRTTGSTPSRCLLRDPGLYERSFRTAFMQYYGAIEDYVVLGLLPSYLERAHSSLVYMVNDFINNSGKSESGFYLNEFDQLFDTLQSLENRGQKTLLIGVTFALLDFAEQYQMKLRHTLVMETGGMKGRREEWTRSQVHALLQQRLGVEAVHSEYGMTELLSQAYSKGQGRFRTPPWMRVTLRDMDDPLSQVRASENQPAKGLINVTDLANLDSCAFIATDDLGISYADGSFEVRGRRDQSDLRGCSLMAV